MQLCPEEWVEVWYVPKYLISNWGRVVNSEKDSLMKPRLSGWGYFQVCLTEGDIRAWRYIHRLVAEHFVPGEDVGLQVNHIDGDKTYNNEINLEWVTRSMNIQHAYDTGLRQSRGIRIQNISTGEVYASIQECASAIGMTPPGVKYALRYETVTRNGHAFRYV